MAPAEKKGTERKWNEDAERDLIISMLCAAGGSGSSIKVNWTAVHASMTELGYDFTKDAMNQKFGKGMMKAFRQKYGDDIITRLTGHSSTVGTGTEGTSTPRRKAPGSGAGGSSKRKKTGGFTPVNPTFEDEEDDDEEDVGADTPSKKPKKEAETSPPVQHPNDKPIGFEAWIKEENDNIPE